MFHIWLCIEVDATGHPGEYVAVCNPVVLGHAHPDAVASRVDEVSGRVDSVVDGVLSSVDCISEHGQFITETVGITYINSGLASL